MNTFIENCISNEEELSNVDNYIDYWHDEYTGNQELHEFLGLTPEEYHLFVLSPDNLIEIIKKYKKNNELNKL